MVLWNTTVGAFVLSCPNMVARVIGGQCVKSMLVYYSLFRFGVGTLDPFSQCPYRSSGSMNWESGVGPLHTSQFQTQTRLASPMNHFMTLTSTASISNNNKNIVIQLLY